MKKTLFGLTKQIKFSDNRHKCGVNCMLSVELNGALLFTLWKRTKGSKTHLQYTFFSRNKTIDIEFG